MSTFEWLVLYVVGLVLTYLFFWWRTDEVFDYGDRRQPMMLDLFLKYPEPVAKRSIRVGEDIALVLVAATWPATMAFRIYALVYYYLCGRPRFHWVCRIAQANPHWREQEMAEHLMKNGHTEKQLKDPYWQGKIRSALVSRFKEEPEGLHLEKDVAHVGDLCIPVWAVVQVWLEGKDVSETASELHLTDQDVVNALRYYRKRRHVTDWDRAYVIGSHRPPIRI